MGLSGRPNLWYPTSTVMKSNPAKEQQGDVREPERIRINTSLIDRPLFCGVDMEFLFVIALAIWFSFLTFKLSLAFVIVLAMCLILLQAMRMANQRDQFFLPILLRSLLYRRIYAARSGPLEQGTVRPTIPKRPIQV